MADQPRVSIIIPCYNRADLIGDTLHSVIAQTYENWECIVVDDHSTDNSINIIQQYCDVNSGIQLLHRPENCLKGAQTCRNSGIEHASGKYIIFLDSDDMLSSFCLEQRTSFMEENPDLDFAVFPQLYFYNAPGDNKRLVNIVTDEDDITRFLKLAKGIDVPWVNNSPIWRKESLTKYDHKWNPEVLGYQDIDFHLRAILSGMKYEKVDTQPDCFWRQHNGARVGQNLFSDEKSKSHEQLFTFFAKELFKQKILTPEREEALDKFLFILIEKYVVQEKFQQAKEFSRKIQQLHFLNAKFLRQLNIYVWFQMNFKRISLVRRGINFMLRKFNYGKFYQLHENCHFAKHNFEGVIKV